MSNSKFHLFPATFWVAPQEKLKNAIENESVEDLYDNCIKNLRRLGQISTSDNYKTAKVSLLKFKL